MDVQTDGQKHLDPYDVHKENMKLLKIMPVSRNRSAPNSPMARRAKDKDGPKANFLSPSPQRKDFKNVTEDNRTKSLTLLTVGDGNSLSPSESPVGSPLSVSDRIIRTHYLSNTTGKPGSYLLKKSDEIVRNKESPTGSPKPGSSPNVGGISPIPHRKSDTYKNKLSVPSPIPVVVSPATGGSTIGFKGPDQEHKPERKPFTKLTKNDDELLDSNELELLVQEGEHLENMRQSIGDALKPKPSPPPPPVVEKKTGEKKKQKSGAKLRKKELKREKLRLHHYETYGNTGKSPGFLTPPLEPRGSKDLSAEMAKWERKERKLFHDLDHVEEGSSSADPSDDESLSGEEDNRSKDPRQVFTMPPVYENVPHQLQSRDFSVPKEIPDGVDEETWNQMKRCRYLRIDGEEVEEEDEQMEEGNLSDSFEDDMETDEEDN